MNSFSGKRRNNQDFKGYANRGSRGRRAHHSENSWMCYDDNGYRSNYPDYSYGRGRRGRFMNRYDHHPMRPNVMYYQERREEISVRKESTETLRNRIRSDAEYRENMDRERLDQVKNKVKQLQRKLGPQSTDEEGSYSGRQRKHKYFSTPESGSPREDSVVKNTESTLADGKLPEFEKRSNKKQSLPETPVSSHTTNPEKVSRKKSVLDYSNAANHPSSKRSKNSDLNSSKPEGSQVLLLNTLPVLVDSSGSEHYEKSMQKTDKAENGVKLSNKKKKLRKSLDVINTLDYDKFKASIVKKDPKHLKVLIENPSFLQKILMTKLVTEHRDHISEKLNQLRFQSPLKDKSMKCENAEKFTSELFTEVKLKDLPSDFVSEISSLIRSQSRTDQKPNEKINSVITQDPSSPLGNGDDEVFELPCPPKTPPLCINLSDEEAMESKNRGAEDPLLEISDLCKEESKLKKELQAIESRRNEINERLFNISQIKNDIVFRVTASVQKLPNGVASRRSSRFCLQPV